MTESAIGSAFSRGAGRIVPWFLGLLLLIFAGWTLRAMATVAVPLVFALLLTLVMRPLDRRISGRLPTYLSWLGRAAVMGLLLLVLALFTAGIGFATRRLLETLPDVSERITEWLSSARPLIAMEDGGAGAALVNDLAGALRDSIGALGTWAVGKATGFAETLVGATGGLVAGLVIVFFLVLLGLSESPLWSRKLDALCSRQGRTAWRDTLDVTAQRVRAFIVVRAVVGLLTAAVYVAWLAVFGIDLLLVWAILALLLSFIPTFGSVVAGTLPFLFALLTKDPGTALIVGAGLFVIEHVIGNYVDPRLQGRRIVLSPLVILVALLFWGWFWGIAGALLAVPITIAFLAICNQITALRPVALALSNQPKPEDLDDALSR